MKYFGWVFLFFVLVYIFPLANRPLVFPCEFKTGESAGELLCAYPEQEIVDVDLRENEPPLAYWFTVGSVRLFGKNNFALRFPVAVAAGLMSLFLWILVKQTTGDEKLAALSSIIFLSCSAVYLCGTLAIPETVSAMFAVGGAGCSFMALLEKHFTRRKALLMLLVVIFCCGALLSSGLPGVIVLTLATAGYIALERRWREFFIMLLPVLLLIFAALLFFVRFEVLTPVLLLRQLTATPGQPWYAMILMLIVGSFPVALLIPAASLVGRGAWSSLLRQPIYRFALCFVLVPLIWFSCPGVMRNALWLLPCFTPVAVLIAAGVRAYFNSGGHHRSYNWLMTLWGAVLVLSGIVMLIYAFDPGILNIELLAELPLSPWFCQIMGVVSVISGGLMFYSLIGNWRGRLYLFFFSLGLFPFCGNFLIAPNRLMPEKVYHALAEELDISEDVIFLTEKEYVDAVRWSFRDRKPTVRILSEPVARQLGIRGTVLIYHEAFESIQPKERQNNYRIAKRDGIIMIYHPGKTL